ncbi:MAG: hypothetical protein JST84_04545 [Acidobacteria bacterium]|nr:hypothetical protein [Acidobacteriota bacterium]
MKKLIASIMILSFSLTVFAQSKPQQVRRNPYPCLEIAKGSSIKDIRNMIKTTLANSDPKDAHSYCELAELMKRAGDYRAEENYRKAISADETEPAFEVFYAEYLRNFRGPQKPLLGDAEQHYFEAWKKLKMLNPACATDASMFDCETQRRIERGLVALYQEDGVPLWHTKVKITNSSETIKKPVAFLGSINNLAKSTTDPERVGDVRDFTSEASFSASRQRLNRPLTKSELQGIIRGKPQGESLDRLRLRIDRGVALDFFYKFRAIDNAQITNFYVPNQFNDLRLHDYGVALGKVTNLAPYFDLYLRGAYRRIKRIGLIEFLPNNQEEVNHYEANAAISRFLGPDKANLEFTYVYNDIKPEMSNPPKRTRSIMAGKFTYQLFRPIPILRGVYENRFETRGLDLFIGALKDKEQFGSTDVTRNDYFVGAALKGIGKQGKIDLVVQPTIFTADVERDKSQQHSQYRTNASFLYRILDEEQRPGKGAPAFLHLVIPFSHDIARYGLKDFENYKIGVALNTKFFTTGDRRTTFLASIRYDHQNFLKLNKGLNLFSLNFSMGF